MSGVFPMLGIRLIEELGKAGIKILLILHRHGRMTVTGILRRGIGHTSFYRALEVLKSYELVKEERIGNARVIMLTELGREIAEGLKTLDQKIVVKSRVQP